MQVCGMSGKIYGLLINYCKLFANYLYIFSTVAFKFGQAEFYFIAPCIGLRMVVLHNTVYMQNKASQPCISIKPRVFDTFF